MARPSIKGSREMERGEATSVGLGSQLDMTPCRRATGTVLSWAGPGLPCPFSVVLSKLFTL